MKAADLFAGLGGTSQGAKQAGVEVLCALNHSPLAVHFHERNHPGTQHFCQDLKQFNFHQLPDIDLLLASPCCQGHSRARGKDRPHHDASRATAWAVVEALSAKRPPLCVIENVPDMRTWPLYEVWKEAMRVLGYSIQELLVDAADSGEVPQNRVRLFLVLSRSANPIRLKLAKHDHQPIEPVIQWDSYAWSPVSEKVPNTQARWQNGRARFGERFVMPYYSSGSGLTGRSLDRPIGTIAKVATWGVVRGHEMRMLQIDETRASMNFPPEYQLPGTLREANLLLGDAVPPGQAAYIIRAVKEAA